MYTQDKLRIHIPSLVYNVLFLFSAEASRAPCFYFRTYIPITTCRNKNDVKIYISTVITAREGAIVSL